MTYGLECVKSRCEGISQYWEFQQFVKLSVLCITSLLENFGWDHTFPAKFPDYLSLVGKIYIYMYIHSSKCKDK